MGLRSYVSSLLGKAARNMSPENPSTPLAAIAKWLGAGTQTVAGELVNEKIALGITTVRTCVTVLAESVASLPCLLYEKTKKGRVEANNQLLHYILSVQPNDEMSAFTFWETMVGANALTGNSYAEIAWRKDGQVGEIYPLNALMTEPYRQADGFIGYRTKQGVRVDDQVNGGTKVANPSATWRYLDAKNVIHLRLFSLDGLKGLSPVALARQSLGLTIAAEKFGAKYFGNGSKPGGVLTQKLPKDGSDDNEHMDETQLDDARRAWEAAHGGSNQGRTAVLSGEWVYQQIGLSPEDSQFLATRNFQRAEIAAMFRVPSHMAGDTSKISNSSYEQMTLSFVSDTLRPILTRIESELNRKLLPTMGSKAHKFFVKFDLSERLRSDHETTMKGIALGRQWGLITANEGRLALGMNPTDDASANVLLYPVNMANALQTIQQAHIQNVQEQQNAQGGSQNPNGSDDTDDDEPTPKSKGTKLTQQDEDAPEPQLEA